MRAARCSPQRVLVHSIIIRTAGCAFLTLAISLPTLPPTFCLAYREAQPILVRIVPEMQALAGHAKQSVFSSSVPRRGGKTLPQLTRTANLLAKPQGFVCTPNLSSPPARCRPANTYAACGQGLVRYSACDLRATQHRTSRSITRIIRQIKVICVPFESSSRTTLRVACCFHYSVGTKSQGHRTLQRGLHCRNGREPTASPGYTYWGALATDSPVLRNDGDSG